jgi:hypothetical protein
MKKAISAVISFVFLVTICVGPAMAEPPVCTVPVHVNEPCSGVLLPPGAAAKGLTCLKYDLPRLQLKLDQEKALFVSYKSYSDRLLSVEKSRGDDYKTLLNSSLEVESGPVWYEHPVFWFTIGFIVATGTTVGITYAVNDGK